ncbi:hypothetical protein LZ30DRAFT_718561 [Colletotrichum cereale]|nr:hypothetical protein LZ30DRAFT_718561 [Colletotrichum cereale]
MPISHGRDLAADSRVGRRLQAPASSSQGLASPPIMVSWLSPHYHLVDAFCVPARQGWQPGGLRSCSSEDPRDFRNCQGPSIINSSSTDRGETCCAFFCRSTQTVLLAESTEPRAAQVGLRHITSRCRIGLLRVRNSCSHVRCHGRCDPANCRLG